MTDAFVPTRAIRALAITGALGLALAPIAVTSSFAASGASTPPGPSAQASVPAVVNSGVDGGHGGLVALGVGGAVVVSLGALGVRRTTSG